MTTPRRSLDFVTHTLPWIDGVRFQIEDNIRAQPTDDAARSTLRSRLFHWMWHGYVNWRRTLMNRPD